MARRVWIAIFVLAASAACDPPSGFLDPLGLEVTGVGWGADQSPIVDSVTFTMTTRNFSAATVEFPAGRLFAFDFVVRSEGGDEVWRRLGGVHAAPAVPFSIAPGQEDRWEQGWHLKGADGSRVPPGTYRVQGLVGPDMGAPLATSVESSFVVAPPPPP